jgi:hypothetical protein
MKSKPPLFILLALLLMLPLMLPLITLAGADELATSISVMPSEAVIGEEVLIDLLPPPEGEVRLQVKSPTQTFRYAGEWDGTLSYTAQELGVHRILLFHQDRLEAEQEFIVSVLPEQSFQLAIDKERLSLGEQVIITARYNEERLLLTTPSKELRFMGGSDLPILYTPDEPGVHRLDLQYEGAAVRSISFIVEDPSPEDSSPILAGADSNTSENNSGRFAEWAGGKNSGNTEGGKSVPQSNDGSGVVRQQQGGKTVPPKLEGSIPSGKGRGVTPQRATGDEPIFSKDPYTPREQTPITFVVEEEELDPPDEEPAETIEIEMKDRNEQAFWSEIEITPIDEPDTEGIALGESDQAVNDPGRGESDESSPPTRLMRAMGVATDALSGRTLSGVRKNVALKPANHVVERLELRSLNTEEPIAIGLDTVPTTAAPLAGRETKRTFAIDMGTTDFVDGDATLTAVGSELWKCALWNFEAARCDGSWVKVQNLVPGEKYAIEIFPGDPGYAETGVATINSIKPIYSPGQTAEFLIVALDTAGHLVVGAAIDVTITEPDGSLSSRSTGDSSIVMDEPGIYSTSFPVTQEGNHTLFVTIQGTGVNSTMLSSFESSTMFPFDIIRNTPASTDPFIGTFTSSITINELLGAGSFDYVEILPSSFTVFDNGGATVTFTARGQELRWNGLSHGDTVSYEALPPLITPDLHAVRGEVHYAASQVFEEARPWWLAIDPEAGYSSFESGDIDMCAMGKERFAIGWCQNEADPDDACRLAVYNTNGSLIDDIDIELSSAIYSRIALACVSSTDILVGHIDAAPEVLRVGRVQLSGGTLSIVDGFDNVDTNYADGGEDGFDIGFAVTDASTGWLVGTDNEDEDVDMNQVTVATLALGGDIQVDGRTDSDTDWDNNVDICAFDSTRLAVCWFDDRGGNFFRSRIYDNTGTSVVGTHNVEGDIGADGAISCDCMRDNKVAYSYYDSDDDNIYIRVSDYTGDAIGWYSPAISIDSNAGTSERIATAELELLGESYFATAFSDSNDGNVKVGIYDINGSEVTPPIIVTSDENVNELYRMVDVVGADSNMGFNICEGKFIVAYTKNDGQSYWQGFNMDGTAWDGDCNLAPIMTFVDPTAFNDFTPPENYTEVNVTIDNYFEQSLTDVTLDYNGSNTSFYNSNLVLMYNLDNVATLGEDSSSVTDMSPNQANNGTIGLTPTFTTGKYNGAYDFAGGDPNGAPGQTIYAADSPSLDITGQITLEAWFNTDTVFSQFQYVLIKGSNNDRVYGINVEFDDLRFFLNGYGGADDAVALNVLSPNTWYHAVGTYDGTISRLYLNGREVANATHTSTISTNNFPFYVSCRGHNLGQRYCFNGIIDEVRVYNTALDAESVKFNYDGNLQRLDTYDWNLYANLSNLPDGNASYQSCASTAIGDTSCTEERNITMGADVPFINSLECFVQGGSWTDCTNLNYGDTIVQMRSECVAAGGGAVTNVTFIFQNVEDSNVYWNVTTTTNSGDNWIYDNPDLDLDDSGNFIVDVICDQGNKRYATYSWYFPWGTLSSSLDDPTGPVSVVQNWFYNYSATVTCTGGECGPVEAVIDPPGDWFSPRWPYRRTITITENSGSSLNNYAFNFTLDTGALIGEGKMERNCTDIRVTDDLGTAVPFMVDGICGASVTPVWFNTSLGASQSDTYYVYYGASNVQSLSEPERVFPLFINFTNNTVTTFGGAEDVDSGNFEIINDTALRMWGNNWKDTPLSITIISGRDRVLEYWFTSDGAEGEVHGVGFDTDETISSSTTYQIYGTDSWGISGDAAYSGSGWQLMTEALDDFSGIFDKLIFANDADAAQATNVTYLNVRIRDNATVAPSVGLSSEESLSVKGLIPVLGSANAPTSIAFMNFEAPTDFPQQGACGTGGSNQCAATSPWDDFTDCISGDASYGFCSSTEADAGGTGSYGFECRGCDRNDSSNIGGLYIDIPADSCGGTDCDSIIVSYYQMVQGLNVDGVEGSAVFAISDGNWYEVSTCLDGDPDCDCNAQSGCSRGSMGNYAELVQRDICEITGVDCDDDISLVFTSYNPISHGNGDYFGWDEINVTGYPSPVYLEGISTKDFHTTVSNPAYGDTFSCLSSMAGGDSCTVTWPVNGTGESSRTIGEAGTVTTANGAWVPITFQKVYDNPVVVGTTQTQTLGNNGALVFEATNVTTTGAMVRVCKSNGNTGTGCATHPDETVGYIVIDVAHVDNVEGLDGGRFNSSGGFPGDSITTSFSDNFTQPLVFASVQTNNDVGPIEVRFSSVTTNNFIGAICAHSQSSSDACDGGHANEIVGWFAVDLGSNPFKQDATSGTTGATISNSAWTAQSFPDAFTQVPVVVAEVQTNIGGQEVEIDEVRSITTTGVEVRYCELDGPSTCDGHAAEEVAWFAVEPGTLSVGSPPFPFFYYFNPLNYTFIESTLTDQFLVSIVDELDPLINNTECLKVGTGWVDCDSFIFGDTFGAIRTECTSLQRGSIINVSIDFKNVDDNKSYFDVTLVNGSGDLYQYDPADFQILDSGGFSIDITCLDSPAGTGPEAEEEITWSLPFGTLSSQLINPTSDREVANDASFTFTSQVSCTGGECGDMQASIDPPGEWWNRSWPYRIELNITESSGQNLTGYAFNVTLDTATLIADGKMQGNCADIRVTDNATNASLLPYMLDGICNTSNTLVWFNATLNASTTDTFYLYYGRQGAPSLSDPDRVFPIFLNFTRDTVSSYGGIDDVDFANFEILNDTALRMWGNNWKDAARNITSPGNTSQVLEYWFISEGVQGEVNGVGFDTDDATTPLQTYQIYGTQTWGVTGDETYGGIGWQLITETLDEISGTYDRFAFANDADSGQATNITYLNVRVREYASTQPSFSQGIEEEGGKGLIPVGNGTPFYTETSNPMTEFTNGCLGSMVDGDSCNTTWIVWANGELNSTWTFFVIYESLNYSLNITEEETTNIDIRIVDYPLPVITNIQCFLSGTGWVSCDSLAYQDTVTQARAQCTSQSGTPISSMEFEFYNYQDNKTYFTTPTTTENGGFWVADVPDTYILDGGDFIFYARCTENVSVRDNQTWAIPFGTMTPVLLNPTSPANAIQNRSFNFSANVSCAGGECGNFTATLDPLNPYPLAFMDFESPTNFPLQGQCGTAAANQCAATSPWDDFTNCLPSAGYGYCASTEADAGGTGTRGLECRGCDRNDTNNLGGLYIEVNDTACGTAPCEVLNISYYQIVQSIDYALEGSAVWAFQEDQSNLTVVSRCIDGDPECDCDTIPGCTRATMGSYAQFVTVDICSLSGIDCTKNVTIWFSAWDNVQHGGGDYFAWDQINLTGYRRKGIVPMNSGEPFYTINQNPRSVTDLSCLLDMQDGDWCDIWWIVNATGDINTTWDFFVEYGSDQYDADGVSVNTSQVPITIVTSTPPNVSTIDLQPEFPVSFDDLNCSFTIDDVDTFDTLTANVTWFRDGSFYSSSVVSATNGVERTVLLDNSNTGLNEYWRCQVTPLDLESNGTPVNSTERLVALTTPPVLEDLQCERNSSTWVDCSQIQYGDIISRVRANVSDDGAVVNVTFIFSNVDDQNVFFSGTTTDNSTGYFVYDNVNQLINDSGTMNMTVRMVDDLDYARDTPVYWTIAFGTLSISWNTPKVDVNVTRNQFTNFSMDVLCTGGECGNISAILDPLSPFKIVEMTFESPTDFPLQAVCGTAAANQCAATSPWDDFTSCQPGNGYGMCASTYADAGGTGTRGFQCRGCDRDDGPEVGGLYITINNTACGGRQCEELEFSYYEAVFSADDSTEGSAVFAYDSDSGLVLLSQCMDQDLTCECEDIPGCSIDLMGEFARQQNHELCSNPNLDCDDNITLWFTARNPNNQHGNGDYFMWDEIFLTGYAPKGIIPMNSGTPFYTTDQNPMLSSTTSCLESMYDGVNCTVTWAVNATGDLNTTHTMFGFTNATQYPASYNASYTSNITVGIIDNQIPEVDSLVFGPAPAFTGWNLTCNFTVTDANSFDSLTANVSFYRNGALYSSQLLAVTNGLQESVFLGSGNTTAGESWICGVTPYDQAGNGSMVNSTSVLITSTLPPVIHSIECEDGVLGWTSCSNILYDSDLSRVRTNCTGDNNISNATFSFYYRDDSTTSFVIANMTFDDTTDFTLAARCPEDATADCAANADWDTFDRCDDSAGTGYWCASTEADSGPTGTRGLQCRGCDRVDGDNSGGLYLTINNTACGGQPCSDIVISYYQVVESMDNPSEGSIVLVNDSDGVLREVSSCYDGDPDCDCQSISGCGRSTMGNYAEFIEQDLCDITGIDCTENLTVRFTSAGTTADYGGGDHFGWDEILVVGNTPPTPIFTGTSNTTQDGFIVFDNSDYTINQSGTYLINVSCVDTDDITIVDEVIWSVGYGSLLVTLLDPNTDRNVQKDDFFNFTVQVECQGGLCGDTEVSLDPYDYEANYTPADGFGSTGFVWEIDSNNNPPTSINSRTLLTASNAGNMSADDGQRYVTIDPDTGDYVSIEVQTRLNNAIDGLQSLEINFEGQTQNNANVFLYFWNRSVGAWREVNRQFLVADTDTFFSGSVTGDMTQIVNSSRDVSWLILHQDTSDLMRIDELVLGATYQKALISTITGTIPFYTNVSNPYNKSDDSCLLNMGPGDSCEITWFVNASGATNTVHEFFAYANSTTYGSFVSPGESAHIDLTISDANNVPPVVTLVSPLDNAFTNNGSVQFNCSATDNVNLNTMDLYGDFSGLWSFVNSSSISGTSDFAIFNQTLSEGQYLWNCLATDSDLNTDWGNTNYTVTVDQTPANVTVGGPTPGSGFPGTWALLNFTVTDNFDPTMVCNITFDWIDIETGLLIGNGSSFTRNVTDLTSGIHYWNVTCLDEAGNLNTSETWNFTLTDVPPLITLLSPGNLSTTNSSIVFLYRAVDNDGFQNVTLLLNGIENQTDYGVTNGAVNSFTINNIPEGDYNWTVNATDLGNLSTVPPLFFFTVDRSDPTIILGFPPDSHNTTNGTIPINFTVNDNLDPFLTCNITVNGTVLDSNFSAENGVETIRNVVIPDGVSNWNITCIDNAGNSNTSETRSINISQAPFINLLTPAEGYSQQNSEFIFTYFPFDNTALDECSIYINGILNRTESNPVNNASNQFVIDSFSEGLYNWTIVCNDTLGLTGTSQTRNFSRDNTPPVVIAYYPYEGDTHLGQIVPFNWTATDNIDDELTCSVYVDDVLRAADISSLNGAIAAVNVSGLFEGDHNWSVNCSDGAGNYNLSLVKNFTFYQPPTVDLVYPDDGAYVNSSNVSLIYYPADNDNVISAELYVNGTLNQTDNSPDVEENNTFNLSNLPDGPYTWMVSVEDTLNLFTNSSTYSFIVDTEPPNLTILSPSEAEIITWNEFTLNFTISDNLAPTLECNISLDGTPIDSNVTVVSGSTPSYTVARVDGDYEWTVSCIDLAGWRVSTTTNFTVEAPPRIDLNFPINGFRTTEVDFTFNYTPFDYYGFENCTLRFDDGFNGTNSTVQQNQPNYFTLTGLSEMVHQWTVECVDADLNYFAPANETFVIDQTGPEIQLLNPPLDSVLNNNTIDFTWNATDYENITLSCDLYIDGSINLSNITGQSLSIFNETVINLTDGDHNWSVTCRDDLNNSNSSLVYNFTINQPDLITNNSQIWVNQTDPEPGENISIFVNISNIGGNPATNVLISFFNGTPGSGTLTIIGNDTIPFLGLNGSDIASTSWIVPEGISAVWAVADPDDLIGELVETNNNATINVTTLVAKILAPGNNTQFGATTFPITLLVADFLGGFINYTLYVDGVNDSSARVIENTQQIVPVTRTDGSYQIYVEAADDQGRTQDSEAITVIVDTTPPDIDFITPNETHFGSGDVTIVANLTDEFSANITYQTFVDGAPSVSGLIANGAFLLVNLTLIPEGYHTIVIQATDELGNTQNSSALTFIVDYTPPEPVILTLNETWFNISTPVIEFNITDNLSQTLNYTIFVDGNPDVSGTVTNGSLGSDTLSALGEGIHTIVVQGTDLALNDANSTPIVIYIDVTAPSITLLTPGNFENMTNQTVNFTFRVTDNLDNETECLLDVSGDFYFLNATNNTVMNYTLTNLSIGEHLWNVTCIDVAGNVNQSPTWRFYIPAPDLIITAGNITFSNTTPIEGQNLTVNATIFNIGNSTAGAFTVQFYRGDPDFGGVQINGDKNVPTLLPGANITFSVNITAVIGQNDVYVLVDTPLATNGSVTEEDESNNKNFNSVQVGFYHIFSGTTNNLRRVADSSVLPLFTWNQTDATGSNVFVTDFDSTLNFLAFQALGRDTSNNTQFDDFAELDQRLNGTNVTDGINSTWTTGGSPEGTAAYNFYKTIVSNVPIVQSTSVDAFRTGILWDTSDGGTEYNGTQDVIFHTLINESQAGSRGTYDYEVRVPATLRDYTGATSRVAFYAELK